MAARGPLAEGGSTMIRNLARRALYVSVAALTVTAMTAPIAYAAPPANDDLADARRIGQVPSSFIVDTREATTTRATDGGFGNQCMGSNSVWYRIRPTTTRTVRAAMSYFDDPRLTYDAIIGIFRGPANNLTPVACNDDTNIGTGTQARLRADTKYFIAVSTCCGLDEHHGGVGRLRVYTPRPFAVSTPVLTAGAGDISGRALFAGTSRCTNHGAVQITVVVSQRSGDLVARGRGSTTTVCRPATDDWDVTVDSETGTAFQPGPASVTIRQRASDGITNLRTTETEMMTLTSVPARSRP
jgi:hypothetical protein